MLTMVSAGFTYARDGNGMGRCDGTNTAPSVPSHLIPIPSYDGIPSQHNFTYSPVKKGCSRILARGKNGRGFFPDNVGYGGGE